MLRRALAVGLATPFMTLVFSACFDAPSYVGRSCGASRSCPKPLVCNSEEICAYDFVETKPKSNDGGASALADADTLPQGGDGRGLNSRDAGGLDATTSDAQAPEPMCSKMSSTAAKLTVTNHCTNTIDVRWLQANCQELSISTITPGAQVVIDSYVSHEFVVRDKITGQPVLTLAPLLGARSVTACQELLHRYTFDVDGRDAIGGAHATLAGGAFIDRGAVYLDGASAYVDLPIDRTIGTLQSVTVEAWVVWYGSATPWPRLFEFGAGTNVKFFMTPLDDANRSGAAISNSADNQSAAVSQASVTTNNLAHIAVTVNARTREIIYYLNGQISARSPTNGETLDLAGINSGNWIGASRYQGVPFLNAHIIEFRIYRDALSAAQISAAQAKGPDVLPALE